MTTIIHTEHAPAAIGPYVQAIDLGNLYLHSGQISCQSNNRRYTNRYRSASTPILRKYKSNH